MARFSAAVARVATPAKAADAPAPHIKGMYIWGGVGQGKTMILDAFYDCLTIQKKLRVHFHQFMLEVQQVTTGL